MDKFITKQEKIRKANLKFLYGISISDYNRLFSLQKGCCAICGAHQSNLTRKLGVDHCHSTGKIRGLLCGNCNQGLGRFKDSVEILDKAIKYLKV